MPLCWDDGLLLFRAGVSVSHWFLPSSRQCFFLVMHSSANWSWLSVCGCCWRLCQHRLSFYKLQPHWAMRPADARRSCRAAYLNWQLIDWLCKGHGFSLHSESWQGVFISTWACFFPLWVVSVWSACKQCGQAVKAQWNSGKEGGFLPMSQGGGHWGVMEKKLTKGIIWNVLWNYIGVNFLGVK